MRILYLLTVLSISWAGFAQVASQPKPPACPARWPEVRTALFDQMFEADQHIPAKWTASIRIVIGHPYAFEPRIYQVLLLENGTAQVIDYKLKLEEINSFVDTALAKDPCVDLSESESIKGLPVTRKTFSADKKVQELVNQSFHFRLTSMPKKDLNVIVFDPTTYDLQVDGEDRIKYSTIDGNSPVAKWMTSLADTIDRHP